MEYIIQQIVGKKKTATDAFACCHSCQPINFDPNSVLRISNGASIPSAFLMDEEEKKPKLTIGFHVDDYDEQRVKLCFHRNVFDHFFTGGIWKRTRVLSLCVYLEARACFGMSLYVCLGMIFMR